MLIYLYLTMGSNKSALFHYAEEPSFSLGGWDRDVGFYIKGRPRTWALSKINKG